MRLEDAPVGLLLYGSTLICMTEYSTERNGVTTPDCYIVETGEYFWGGAKTIEARNALEVTPLGSNADIEDAIALERFTQRRNQLRRVTSFFMRLLSLLPNRPDEHNDAKIWTNGESIMCRSEDVAYAIADIFDALGGKCAVDYYDPEEDERNGEVDECTGYWYVCV